jgi:hypothetical protein
MKKNIVILALTAFSLISSGFAYRQYSLAQEYKLLSIENEIKAQENAARAEQQAKIAEQSMHEAMVQRAIAAQAVQEDEGRKNKK